MRKVVIGSGLGIIASAVSGQGVPPPVVTAPPGVSAAGQVGAVTTQDQVTQDGSVQNKSMSPYDKMKAQAELKIKGQQYSVQPGTTAYPPQQGTVGGLKYDTSDQIKHKAGDQLQDKTQGTYKYGTSDQLKYKAGDQLQNKAQDTYKYGSVPAVQSPG